MRAGVNGPRALLRWGRWPTEALHRLGPERAPCRADRAVAGPRRRGGGKLVPPEGARLLFQPPYSPELEPAERLWPPAREEVADETFATLADLDRARAGQPDLVEGHTHFHRWPDAA